MNEVKQGNTIAVWFSCGAASAVAAKKTIEKYGSIANIKIINSPILEEHEDNQRFLRDIQEWIGIKIETAVNKKYPNGSAVEVWDKRKYMSGVQGAPCTLELKKIARREWEQDNHVDWHVLGFTFEEKARHEKFTLHERSNVLPILIDLELTKQDCMDIVKQAGVKLPYIYSLGYPNANCIGCVKATSSTYWNLVRNTFPEIFNSRAKQSREINCKLVRDKGKRIFLDELDPLAKGRDLKYYNTECGIFCEMELGLNDN